MFWAGWLGDKTNLWLAKRRNGTHIPEDSLVSLVFPTIVTMIGIVLYGLAADRPESYTSWAIVMGLSIEQGSLSDYANSFFFLRMDSPPVWIHRLPHYFNALRGRSISKQPRPSTCACDRREEYCLFR